MVTEIFEFFEEMGKISWKRKKLSSNEKKIEFERTMAHFSVHLITQYDQMDGNCLLSGQAS